MAKEVERYFLTVDRCNQGKRGIFCGKDGNAFAQDEPFDDDRIWEILDCFYLVLSPQSIRLSESELKKYKHWYPLAEFSHQYGYALEEAKQNDRTVRI